VICEYRPSVLIPEYQRGSESVRPHRRKGYWRVLACAETTPTSAAVIGPVRVFRHGFKKPVLALLSPTALRPGTICSPRAILAKWQEQRRIERVRQSLHDAVNEWMHEQQVHTVRHFVARYPHTPWSETIHIDYPELRGVQRAAQTWAGGPNDIPHCALELGGQVEPRHKREELIRRIYHCGLGGD
jgi:hypothetical protein